MRIHLALLAILLAASAGAAERTERPPNVARPLLPLTPEHEAKKAAQTAQSDALRAALARGVRIVGGGNTTPGKWPFMAALVSRTATNNWEGQFCGGALIHPYWVLTAAHCTDGSDPSALDVVLGAHNLRTDTNVQRIAVEEIIVHPLYNPFTTDFDISLLRLSQPARAQFAPIPIIDDLALDDPGTVATIIGWGNTSASGSSFPDILQEAQVPVVSNAVANQPNSYDGLITDNMLPAGFSAGGIDSCQGDSGGPMIVPVSNGVGWAQIGIVSWGFGCAEPDLYGIYTRLMNFRSFVLAHVTPHYGDWETDNNVTGEYRDREGDTVPALFEYAFRETAAGDSTTNLPRIVNAGAYPAVQFRRPVPSADVDYALAWADNVTGTWNSAALGGLIVTQAAVPGDARAETVVARHPLTYAANPQPSGFLRVQVRPGTNLVNAPRPLGHREAAIQSLTDDDPLAPTNRFEKYYRLGGLPTNQLTRAVLRSTLFDTRLEIRNASNGATLFISTTNSGGGTDERIVFTPNPPTNYIAVVSSTTSNQTGRFTLATYVTNPALPHISLNATNLGTLTTGDAFDPNYLPELYYADDFRIANNGAADDVVVTLRTGSVTNFLMLIDEETGRVLTSDSNGMRFRADAGRIYVLRASTYFPEQTNGYSLGTVRRPAAPTLGMPASINGSLAGGDPDDPRFTSAYNYDIYRLTGYTPGQKIAVTYTSAAYDCWLVLATGNGVIVTENDDGGGGTNSKITFTPEPGVSYYLWASSFAPGDTGAYTISSALAP